MYLTSTLKRTLAIGGISLLAVVGLVGWTRDHAKPAVPTTAATPNWYTPPAASTGRVVYAPSPFGSETMGPPPAQAYAANPEPVSVAPARPVVERRYVRTSRGRRHYVVVKNRPFKHSAAIVAGSAAGGALIGALAGGGKGAAIGALAGGGGGLVYDRLTAKKRVVR
jgi:hypothetical protein